MKRNEYLVVATSIVFATYITKLSRDLLAPSLPAIAHYYNVPNHYVQLSVTIYFIGILLARLFWPTLADYVDNRKLNLISCTLFLFSTCITMWAPNIVVFLAGRLLQSLAISGIPMVNRSQIFYAYGGKATLQLFAMTSILATWAPAVATTVGGYLQTYYYWQMAMYVMFVFGVLGFVVNYFLRANDTHPVSNEGVIETYIKIITHKGFWAVALPFSSLTAVLAVYFTMTPMMFIHALHMAPSQYGMLSFIVVGGMTLGMFMTQFCVKRMTVEQMVTFAVLLSLIVSTYFFVTCHFFKYNLAEVMTMIFLVAISMGLVNVTVKTQAMVLHPTNAGAVLAVLGATEALTSASASAIAAMLSTTTVIGFAGMLAALSLIAAIASRFTVPSPPMDSASLSL